MEEERLFFHECRAAGMVFKTAKDWTDWLQSNEYDINKTVAVHEGFKYNANDVCTNPHEVERTVNTGGYWKVRTSKTQYGWIWGYTISADNGGSASPCSYPSRYDTKAQFLETEKEAKLDALNYIIRQLEGMRPQTKNVKLLVWSAKKVRQEVVHPQLELFGGEV